MVRNTRSNARGAGRGATEATQVGGACRDDLIGQWEHSHKRGSTSLSKQSQENA